MPKLSLEEELALKELELQSLEKLLADIGVMRGNEVIEQHNLVADVLKQIEEREKEAQDKSVLDDRPVVTGISQTALFGLYDDVGYPIAFDKPLLEAAHNLKPYGDEWGVGYMVELGGHWRPVVPITNTPPPEKKEPPPPPPEDKKNAKDQTGAETEPREKGRAEEERSGEGLTYNPDSGDWEGDVAPAGDEYLMTATEPRLGLDGGRGTEATGRGTTPDNELTPCDNGEGSEWEYDPTLWGPFEGEPQGFASLPAPQGYGPGAGFASLSSAQVPIQQQVRLETGSDPRPQVSGLQKIKPTFSPPQTGGGTKIRPIPPRESAVPGADQRTRLGGGPHAPRASLVPKGGIRVMDAHDFALTDEPWEITNKLANKLNQVISLVNDRFPFGPSTLDNAGVYIPPQRGVELPHIPGAWDGTIAHTKNRDGQVQQWIKDSGSWTPQSLDHHTIRTWGSGERGKDAMVVIADGYSSRSSSLPRFGYKAAQRAFTFKNLPLVVESGFFIEDAEIKADSLTEAREYTLPDASGTFLLEGGSPTFAGLTVTGNVVVEGITDMRSGRLRLPTGLDSSKPTLLEGEIYIPVDKNKGYIAV